MNSANTNDNRNRNRRGGRGGGRGGRGGGRGQRPHGDAPTPSTHVDSTATLTSAAAVPRTPPEADEDLRAPLPGAFAVSFPTVTRVKERSRAFVVPAHGSRHHPPADHSRPRRVFFVAERTIAGLDDLVYEKNRDVWESLPRGNARVFVYADSTPQAAVHKAAKEAEILSIVDAADKRRLLAANLTLTRQELVAVAAVNGLRKFSYNDPLPASPPPASGLTAAAANKEEKEVVARQVKSKKGGYGYDDEVDAVVGLEKENGECGHISAFVLPGPHKGSTGNTEKNEDNEGERYWLVGSKNVHIVLPYDFSAEDVTNTYKAKRYGYANKIALQWRDIMDLAEAHTTLGKNTPQGDEEAEEEGGNINSKKLQSGEVGVDKEVFKNVTAEGIRQFHSLLTTHNYTACFEAIFRDSQHLVDYKNRNEFRFFALTDNATYESKPRSNSGQKEDEGASQRGKTAHSYVHGLCIDIQQSFKHFADCGLPTPPIFYGNANEENVSNDNFTRLHKVPYRTAAYEALVDAIGCKQNSEGCVMYGYKLANKNDPKSPGRIVKVWKEKAYPYVMERATREAIVNHKLAGKGLEAKIKKKMSLQKPHIRKYFADWERDRLPFLVLFSAYLQLTRTLTPFMSRDDSFMAVRNHWLSLQRECTAAIERDFELRTVCERFVPGEEKDNDNNNGGGGGGGGARLRNSKRLDVVKFVGAQGCGKSTISRVLFFLLAEANYRPRWLNQDEAGNRNNYLAAIRQAAQEAYSVGEERKEASASPPQPTQPLLQQRITHLLLDKMNLDQRTNNDYNCLPEPAVTVCFTFEGEAGEEGNTGENARKRHAMTDLLFSRVVNRGAGHRTIKIPDGITLVERKQEEDKIYKFLSQAVRACEVPEDDEHLIFVDVTDTLQRQVGTIWAALQENGYYELPNLDTLHLDVAIDVARRYETLLTRQARTPIYACITVAPDQQARLLDCVQPASVLEGKKTQPAFHVTTKYFVGDPDPLYFVALAELEGTPVTLHLESIGADDKGVAVRVRSANPLWKENSGPGASRVYENDIIAYLLSRTEATTNEVAGARPVPRCAFPCANAIPHITIANAPGIPPKYSSELLARDPGVAIPGDVAIKGTFAFR